jgi:hypothetical protein
VQVTFAMRCPASYDSTAACEGDRSLAALSTLVCIPRSFECVCAAAGGLGGHLRCALARGREARLAFGALWKKWRTRASCAQRRWGPPSSAI